MREGYLFILQNPFTSPMSLSVCYLDPPDRCYCSFIFFYHKRIQLGTFYVVYILPDFWIPSTIKTTNFAQFSTFTCIWRRFNFSKQKSFVSSVTFCLYLIPKALAYLHNSMVLYKSLFFTLTFHTMRVHLHTIWWSFHTLIKMHFFQKKLKLFFLKKFVCSTKKYHRRLCWHHCCVEKMIFEKEFIKHSDISLQGMVDDIGPDHLNLL